MDVWLEPLDGDGSNARITINEGLTVLGRGPLLQVILYFNYNTA